MNDITPPQDIETERAVLGTCFYEPKHSVNVISENGGDLLFYNPKHIMIWKAVYELYTDGEAIDQLTVYDIVKKKCKYDEVLEQDIAFISGLCTSSSSLNSWLKILKEKALLRGISALCLGIKAGCDAGKYDSITAICAIEDGVNTLKDTLRISGRGLIDKIREWIAGTERDISVTDLDKELGIGTTRDKEARRKIMQRLVKEGTIMKSGSKDNIFRKVDADCMPMDWKNADAMTLDVVLPLNIHEYVEIMPKNIIVIAGEQNSGKTAFLMNVARENMDRMKVSYFSSEMGPLELKKRIERFQSCYPDLYPDNWNLSFFERSENFADVIRPNGLNIIDFLEVHDDFWKVGEYIKGIFDKLNKGIAVIALQKDPDKQFGRGGSLSMEKPRLYLALKHGECKILKAKNWKTITNPNNMTCKFKIVQGSKIIPEMPGWIMPKVKT